MIYGIQHLLYAYPNSLLKFGHEISQTSDHFVLDKAPQCLAELCRAGAKADLLLVSIFKNHSARTK